MARRARELYQEVVDADPTHALAGEGLGRILEAEGDFPPLVRMLEARSEVLRGEKRWTTLARIAEIFDAPLEIADGPKPDAPGSGRLELIDVGFRFPDAPPDGPWALRCAEPTGTAWVS